MRASTILCHRIGGALWPDDQKSAETLRRIARFRPVAVRVMRERSHEQLAMYWRCLERVVEATGRWRCPEELHLALKVATGRISEVELVTGRRVLVPDSTAFDAMTQDEFQAYMDAALRVLCDEVMGGMAPEELLGHLRLVA